jgi:uncharacterized protein (DUF4415 family)
MSISKERLREIEAIKDEDIDFSEIPELDDEWFKEARIIMPESKKAVSLRIDREVLNWFKARGKGYQSLINAVLKAYMNAQKAKKVS